MDFTRYEVNCLLHECKVKYRDNKYLILTDNKIQAKYKNNLPFNDLFSCKKSKKMSGNQNAYTFFIIISHLKKSRATNQNTHTTNFTCEKYDMQ